MLANVTQTLTIQIVPVNDPIRDWKHSGYRAYVTHDDELLADAQNEIYRGIVPITVGYGASGSPRIAALNALDDYADKFGRLCVADTDNAA